MMMSLRVQRRLLCCTNNRLFDGRRVIADFFDEKKYKDGKYGEPSGCNSGGAAGKNGGTAEGDDATEGTASIEGAAAAPQESMSKVAEVSSNSPDLDCAKGDDATFNAATHVAVEKCTNSLARSGSSDDTDSNSKSEMPEECG